MNNNEEIKMHRMMILLFILPQQNTTQGCLLQVRLPTKKAAEPARSAAFCPIKYQLSKKCTYGNSSLPAFPEELRSPDTVEPAVSDRSLHLRPTGRCWQRRLL